MDPITLALGAGGLLSGVLGAGSQNAQRKREMKMNALDTQYSPWVNPSYQSVSGGASPVGGAIGGAASGISLGQSLSGSMKPAEKSPWMPQQDRPKYNLGGNTQLQMPNVGAGMGPNPYAMNTPQLQNPWGR